MPPKSTIHLSTLTEEYHIDIENNLRRTAVALERIADVLEKIAAANG